MAEPGRIYWSAKAERFYQEGRRGSVSSDEAFKVVRYNEASGRFIDQRGRFVPKAVAETPVSKEITFMGRDTEGRPYLKSTWTAERISETAAQNMPLKSNQEIVVRTVMYTPDGKVVTSRVSSGLGQRYSAAYLNDLADRRARADFKDASGKPYTQDISRYVVRRDYEVVTINPGRG